MFFPDPLKGRRGAARSVSLTDRQGVYHLKDDKGQDGIEAGICRVCIVDPRTYPIAGLFPIVGMTGRQASRSPRFSTAISDPLTTPFKGVEVNQAARKTSISRWAARNTK